MNNLIKYLLGFLIIALFLTVIFTVAVYFIQLSTDTNNIFLKALFGALSVGLPLASLLAFALIDSK
ncbi:hypothetical protein EKK58_10220 [Candidatus Dependentiae bacterium]|nr:MAG: hypothetical protein EKK58_10220 [Candidatus Dependentiae bacterium]